MVGPLGSLRTPEDEPPVEKQSLEDYFGEEYQFLSRITNITRFSHEILISSPNLSSLSKEGLAHLAESATRVLYGALDSARFFGQSNLSSEIVGGTVRLLYEDPELGFRIEISDLGKVTLSRHGSSFRRFHEWYRGFAMTYYDEFVSPVIEILRRLSTGGAASPPVAITSAQFVFSVIAHNISFPGGAAGSETGPANLRAMEKVVSQVPDEFGRLTPSGSLADPHLLSDTNLKIPKLGRIDYTVSRTVVIDESDRESTPQIAFEYYGLEAPSNNSWGTLWCTFGLGGHSFESSTGDRVPFDGEAFLRPITYDMAYRRFFRDKALVGFLQGVLGDADFDTTAGSIP